MPLSKQAEAERMAAILAGESYKDIARRLGVSHQAIANFAMRRGVPLRRKAFTSEEVSTILRLFDRGKSGSYIAGVLKRSAVHVNKCLRDHGRKNHRFRPRVDLATAQQVHDLLDDGISYYGIHQLLGLKSRNVVAGLADRRRKRQRSTSADRTNPQQTSSIS